MEENLIRKNMWNGAAVAGLALGGVSTIYMLVTMLMEKVELSTSMNLIFTSLLWIGKFGGCIWLMMFFMKKFAAENPEVDNKGTRRFGIITALLSALVFAAASFANVAFISPDTYAEAMDQITQQMAPMMDSNTMNQMTTMMERLPQMTFFSNLFYCFIYGSLLSAILSAYIPNKDPFADYKPEDQ